MKRMVIDVESVGLHGEGFAVGYVVLDEQGIEVASGLFSCPHAKAEGTFEDRTWIIENVIPHLPLPNCKGPEQVRTYFWTEWMALKTEGPVEMWADCAWPVETNFLAACVADFPASRNWDGPYPLHDVATMLKASDQDPMATYLRLPSELPAHNPLADARQSARLLLGAETMLDLRAPIF